MTKTLLTKEYGVIESNIDKDLQSNNNYTEWGMYLIKVDENVVWGYDTEKYEYRENDVVKKNSSK